MGGKRERRTFKLTKKLFHCFPCNVSIPWGIATILMVCANFSYIPAGAASTSASGVVLFVVAVVVGGASMMMIQILILVWSEWGKFAIE